MGYELATNLQSQTCQTVSTEGRAMQLVAYLTQEPDDQPHTFVSLSTDS